MQFRLPNGLLVLLSTGASIVSHAEGIRSVETIDIARSLASDKDRFLGHPENIRRILQGVETPRAPFSVRRLQEGQGTSCDAAFVGCLPSSACTECFTSLVDASIDWTGLSSSTTCLDVKHILVKNGYCLSVDSSAYESQLFCDAFDACVVWGEDDDDYTIVDDDEYYNNKIDCSTLTECEWEGMHPNWIGDGVCHDNMDGCYNTEICGYDGGDCCEDTCTITDTSSYMECGHDGYFCKDPASDNCDSLYTTKCPSDSKGGKSVPDPKDVTCKEDESKYALVMYDSFGDGWDSTTLTIKAEGSDEVAFVGGLVDGFEGTEYICLSRSPQCYNVVAGGGTWGVEVSWEIKPLGQGKPAFAGGGAPGDCDFSVAGEVCSKTCDGRKPDIDPTDDPDYNSFKKLYGCIDDKCIIQLGACEDDPLCSECFTESSADYCYSIDTFNAVIECTMCSCTEKAGSEYCMSKAGTSQVRTMPPEEHEESKRKRECTPKETMQGTEAIMDFSSCTNLDSLALLISDFDQNNFGQLDSFETCAHSFKDEDNHGGRTALSCMQILKNTITNPVVDEGSDAPVEAISALASNLYDHAETFCDCSKRASDACPLCPKFMNFKSILYESIDACQSLDAIDCDSWNEFWKPCKNNLEKAFDTSDLVDKEQCDYVKDDCGGAGPFPAFRRLDCESEIPTDAWDFYKKYSKSCLKGSDGVPPTKPPITIPPKPTPNKPKPTPKPAPTQSPKPAPVPSPQSKPTPKPYIPSSDDDAIDPIDPSSSEAKAGKSRWFRNLVLVSVLGGIGYFVYKKRNDGFSFVQYRRRVFGNRGGFQYGMVDSSGYGESEMYGNLNSSTTFEPPSLPPTPQMMNYGNP